MSATAMACRGMRHASFRIALLGALIIAPALAGMPASAEPSDVPTTTHPTPADPGAGRPEPAAPVTTLPAVPEVTPPNPPETTVPNPPETTVPNPPETTVPNPPTTVPPTSAPPVLCPGGALPHGAICPAPESRDPFGS